MDWRAIQASRMNAADWLIGESNELYQSTLSTDCLIAWLIDFASSKAGSWFP